ncbi:LOW QUALITY PROTEIN: trichohyalin-like, partial [Lucilia sericata]|uniref:LOW QUALITY PROTEIN: trichohyalin-like n=1 Tax=Lucilia sericata TaxID=13632 RepID=UPI0018A7F89F
MDDNGDDFDSFFNTKKTKSSTQTKTSKISSDPMEDLFGLTEKTSNQRKPTASSKAIREEPEDDDDDLGFDPKKPKALTKSQNLFDDILAPLETKRPQTSAGPSTSNKPSISRQSTETTTDTSNIFQAQAARPKTSQGRRTSNMSATQNPDPLGLFTKEKETSKPSSRISSPKTQKRSNTADWLGLAKDPEIETVKVEPRAETPKTSKLQKASSKETTEILKLPEPTDNQEDFQTEVQPEDHEEIKQMPPQTQDHLMLDSTSQNIMLMNTLNLEAKQSFSALKYQEQQLIMASQMKQQERVLMDMQHKQDSLLQQQERQFQALFQQQMQRHQQLEDLIKHQQQRINSHIQLLMSQPPMTQSMEDFELLDNKPVHARKTYREDEEENETETTRRDLEKEKQMSFDFIQLESDNKRLELENLRLEELIANTKSNYEREIELLERSYKKQIEVLEQHLSSVEKRLKSELEEVQTYFQTKIDVLEQEKITLKKNYEEELSNLKQDHEDDLRKLRKNQEEDLEMLKEEHRRMLDNIRQAKMLEFAAVQENGSYLDCLKVASSNLSDLTGGLNELKENMQNKMEILQLEREKALEQREKKIEDSERRLKITEESNDLEKQRLMDLVSTLELQMSKISKDSAEENWQLRQKLASIDAEKMAFNKEKEFFREQMLRDEERIKDLKEQQLLETQKLQVQLQEERAQLQVEKSKFELEKRLQSNTDVQKERMEVEAAMQVTQDAARKADLERERFYKMQRQLEQQKRDLSDKEHALNVREEELHQELLSYRMAERVAQESQQKAKMAEQFYQNKLQLLQQRSNEIAEKETNLSQERLLLAQDRIALHALKTKLSQQPKCSLCQLSQRIKRLHNLYRVLRLIYLTFLRNLLWQMLPPRDNYDFLHQTNVVERLLDANIADSLRKMQTTSNFGLEWENLLDDDHKKM